MSRLYEAFNAATSKEAWIPIMKEFNEYIMRQHFQVYGHKAPLFQLAHPWVKGFNGETQLHGAEEHLALTRLWLDQDLKREMGYCPRPATRSNGDGVAGTTCHPFFLCNRMWR